MKLMFDVLVVDLLLLHMLFSNLVVVSADGGDVRPKVPAVYVFGDSTADVGNNNYLPAGNNTAKANFPFNGIDFPHLRPTGRFSNGYIGVDFLAIKMGFRRSPPPYLSLANKTSHQILKNLRGVNFASAGSGILDTTGTTITMRKQIQYFAKLRATVVAGLGVRKTRHLLSKSVFIISSGGNDAFAFFALRNNSPKDTQKEQFYHLMVSNYESHIKELYHLGARKFAIVDVAPLGCCPFWRRQHPAGACVDVLNELARGVNSGVKHVLSRLSSTLQGMKYSVGSSYALVSNIIANPQPAGYKEVKSACCGSGKLNAESLCTPNATYCANRNQYLFWDLIHPTHATAKRAGFAFYGGSLHFASPINLKQLVENY